MAQAQEVMQGAGSYLGSELQLSADQQSLGAENGGCDGATFRPASARPQQQAEALASAYAAAAARESNSVLASTTDALFGSDSNLFAAAAAAGGPGCGAGVGVRPLTEADQVLLNMLQRLLYELMDAVPDAEGDSDSDPGAAGSGLGSCLGAGSGPGPSGTCGQGGPSGRAVPECEHSPAAFLRITDAFIRRFIKFCKILPEFAMLPQDDQIALLKVCSLVVT